MRPNTTFWDRMSADQLRLDTLNIQTNPEHRAWADEVRNMENRLMWGYPPDQVRPLNPGDLRRTFQEVFNQSRETPRRVTLQTGEAGMEAFRRAVGDDILMVASGSTHDVNGVTWRSSRIGELPTIMSEDELQDRFGDPHQLAQGLLYTQAPPDLAPPTNQKGIAITEDTDIVQLMEELYGSTIQEPQGHNHS